MRCRRAASQSCVRCLRHLFFFTEALQHQWRNYTSNRFNSRTTCGNACEHLCYICSPLYSDNHDKKNTHNTIKDCCISSFEGKPIKPRNCHNYIAHVRKLQPNLPATKPANLPCFPIKTIVNLLLTKWTVVSCNRPLAVQSGKRHCRSPDLIGTALAPSASPSLPKDLSLTVQRWKSHKHEKTIALSFRPLSSHQNLRGLESTSRMALTCCIQHPRVFQMPKSSQVASCLLGSSKIKR